VPVECELRIRDRLADPLEAAAYFIVAEALTNVAKYAHATTAHVRVLQLEDELEVEVVDDGIGGASSDRGSGLRGLADRVAAVDGTLSVKSPEGRGTRVLARIPYDPSTVLAHPPEQPAAPAEAPSEGQPA
jgi:signal transduction histidine kinase